jgi:glycosyltransferase involved in cell wall biosynthesis
LGIKVSLIISVYKKIKPLNLIFEALKNQSFKEFEVIISDDGSGEEMNEFISLKSKESLFPVKHIYQEDSGFRKNKILNNSIVNSEGEYLIFLDGDCIPHAEFIKEHYINKKDNTALCGRRVMLGKRISEKVIQENNTGFSPAKLFWDSVFGGEQKTSYADDSVYLNNNIFRKKIYKQRINLTGCNFSLPKNTILKINGFDENYAGPGIGEDSDIEFRLKLFGAEFSSVKNLAIIYHIFHIETKVNPANIEYFTKVKNSCNFICKNGIEKLD